MIKPILYQLLSSEEFYTLCQRIIEVIENSSLEENFKTAILTRIKQHFSAFNEAIHHQKTNPLTVRSGQLDQKRDGLFIGFRTYNEAMSYHWDEEIKAAADFILEVIRRHGWSLHRKGNTAQSASLNSLFGELQKEPATTHVTKAGAGEWLSQLIQSQQEYQTISVQREELDAVEKPTIVSTRKKVYNDLQSTLNYMDSQASFNSNVELDDTIGTINEVITSVTSSAKARRTRQESEEIND